MILYLAVDATRYELPLAVCDTCEELAKTMQLRKKYVIQSICKERSGRINGNRRGFRMMKIEVDDDE